ncbi:hypothetical protein [Amycolatopsis sp. DSM 110486]|uniref:hypothetical protein n=1 Tax=Amycolatopsis sp. DSM 110486 TaxID=2865832 RepID=UPI001C6A6771|nr:hypothetical protein [Amycolatopsis sp. DSM 110486]QYN17599.1 hypothetical protein K1T34_32970 [Amycolatopsis sp. DSM 110486]
MLDDLIEKAKDAYKKGLLWLVKKTAGDILPAKPDLPDVHVPKLPHVEPPKVNVPHPHLPKAPDVHLPHVPSPGHDRHNPLPGKDERN